MTYKLDPEITDALRKDFPLLDNPIAETLSAREDDGVVSLRSVEIRAKADAFAEEHGFQDWFPGRLEDALTAAIRQWSEEKKEDEFLPLTHPKRRKRVLACCLELGVSFENLQGGWEEEEGEEKKVYVPDWQGAYERSEASDVIAARTWLDLSAEAFMLEKEEQRKGRY